MPYSAVLDELEAEAIHIYRETAAAFRNPVLLYSIGKDSSVLLHLAIKAFYPAPLPFPVMHVDTTWKFKEMIEFRDKRAHDLGLDLRIAQNLEAITEGVTPFSHGTHEYTRLMKTVALREGIDRYQFDAAIGGARRDEERSRAKERIYSLREPGHRWDPRKQRPEFWRTANTQLAPEQSMRVFPLSNWTELDIWRYIQRESIEIPDLYFAKMRPVVEREGTLLMVDDERFPLDQGEVPEMKSVRFRTLGCYPLSGAVESTADNLVDLIAEMETSKLSERSGRLIDGEGGGSMEAKKAEGYF
ncbi:MAG: sulfate adenylyltransferase subunit CysD [Candidatus Nanopelagicales bacterium]|nr:sulfate adenylyltransferase subunit CysD [Actinomycetota bacterium]MBT5500592.1 sulfate adenylyltransferase subunit CysD [Actinomycetota bacterium]MBT5806449.1 sulfate adenylyltransferase subunit CysD [Actinomycetota bacterium]MDA9350217.1 sulfate adenylyltransferase subunit CysD [Actinomycetota bacterium]MDA9890725.1 sulfate adenylyltransferase subunit CysD [Actinomycetota bacterium]